MAGFYKGFNIITRGNILGVLSLSILYTELCVKDLS